MLDVLEYYVTSMTLIGDLLDDILTNNGGVIQFLNQLICSKSGSGAIKCQGNPMSDFSPESHAIQGHTPHVDHRC